MSRDMGVGVVSGRRRRTAELRREEILTATLEVVERAGLAATRVSDVAAALGVSPALVFYHFGTKDALLAAAFEHAAERDLAALEEIAASEDAPLDRLRRMLRLYGPTGPATGWRLWIDAWALAQREPRSRPCCGGSTSAGARCCATSSRRAWRRADFRCPDPAAAAPASRRCSTGCRWRRWSTAASPAPSCAAGCARRRRASSTLDPERALVVVEASSHQPVRLVVGSVRAGRSSRNGRQVGGGLAGHGEVGEQPAEGRRELEAVRGAEADHDRLVPRHRREHEVAVGGQRVQAAQRPHRPAAAGQHRAMKAASRPAIAGSGSKVRDSGSTTGPPQSWAALTVGSP